MTDDLERRIRDEAWAKAKLMTWVMAPAPVLYVLVGLLLLGRGGFAPGAGLSGTARDSAFFAALAAGAACIVTAARMAARLRATESPASLSAAAQRFVQTRVVILGLAEAPAAFGLVYVLLTGDVARMIILSSAGAIAALFFLPRRAALDAFVHRSDLPGDTPP